MTDQGNVVTTPEVPSPYAFYDDPLYVSNSDQPTNSLVDVLFTGHDFMNWKREVMLALMAKNKEGFITGTCKMPDKTDKKYFQWLRCDQFVRKWILYSLDRSIRDNVTYCHSAKQLWGELVERYGQINSLELYQLKKDLGSIVQENTLVIEYYSRLKRTWEEIDSIDPIPQCTCGVLDNCSCLFLRRLLDRELQSKMIQLLMGLNPSYETVKSHILTMEPMPQINKALGLLQKAEKQKEISDSLDVLGEVNAYASFKQPFPSSEPNTKKPRLDGEVRQMKQCSHCTKKGHDVTECYKLQTCPLCNVFGHVEFQCYQARGLTRNGLQSGYGRGRGKGRSNSYHRKGNNVYKRPTANNVDAVRSGSEEYEDLTPFDDDHQGYYPINSVNHQYYGGQSSPAATDMVPGLVDKVVQKVMQALSETKSQSNAAYTLPSTSFAGISSSSKVLHQSNRVYPNTWIVDSGASDHMTSCISLVHNVQLLSHPIVVGLPDGSTKLVHKTGTIFLTDSITLHNVLIIPDFTQNLLSVGRLLEHSGLRLIFYANECWFQDHLNKLIVAKAKKHGNLYLIRGQCQTRRPSHYSNNNSNFLRDTFLNQPVVPVDSSTNNCVQFSDVRLLHQRLGHSSFEKLRHLPGYQVSKGTSFDCEICMISKHHKLPFATSSSHAAELFDLIHLDVWGPYRVRSLSGAKSFLTIVDDYSRTTWTFLIQSKDQVPYLIKNFLLHVETQFNAKIRIIRTDNGTEFVQGPCKDMFQQRGIIHQTSIVGRPQQNGRVERKHRHLVETARALRLQANLPLKFWGDCLLTATYLINKMPTPVLQWKTPFELLFHEQPKYDELRVIGSLCFASMPLTNKDKFAKRGRKCVFIGYPFGQKGYKLYDLDTHTCFTSRDVVFKEGVFPYVTENQQSTPEVSENCHRIDNPFFSEYEPEISQNHHTTSLIQHNQISNNNMHIITENSQRIENNDDTFSPTSQITEVPRQSLVNDLIISGTTPPDTAIDPVQRKSIRPKQISTKLNGFHCPIKLPFQSSTSSAS
ncbi:hypothetical protein KSS87_011449, partial [Heliosperma pusillum]